MTDARLRELERRWRQTGAVPDEAALLRERVRIGQLPPERLALAAHLGHEAAAIASSAGAKFTPMPLKAWFAGLAPLLRAGGDLSRHQPPTLAR